MLRADHERGDIDPREVAEAIPAHQESARTELARPLHRDIDGLVDVAEGAGHRLGPLIGWHSQHVVDVVVLHEQLLVLRIRELLTR